jgi:hypothetical protein
MSKCNRYYFFFLFFHFIPVERERDFGPVISACMSNINGIVPMYGFLTKSGFKAKDSLFLLYKFVREGTFFW